MLMWTRIRPTSIRTANGSSSAQSLRLLIGPRLAAPEPSTAVLSVNQDKHVKFPHMTFAVLDEEFLPRTR
jgi:hypothetical protein